MSLRGAEYVVLCEDLQTRVFVGRALLQAGVPRRRVRCLPLASGAGDAWVLSQYATEVRALRRRAGHLSAALIVHVDADPAHTVAARHAQLAAQLIEAGLATRGPSERVVELIPKRNVETWLHELDPQLDPTLPRPLNEIDAYPKLTEERLAERAAQAFIRLSRAATPTSALPSLADGLAEWRRL